MLMSVLSFFSTVFLFVHLPLRMLLFYIILEHFSVPAVNTSLQRVRVGASLDVVVKEVLWAEDEANNFKPSTLKVEAGDVWKFGASLVYIVRYCLKNK